MTIYKQESHIRSLLKGVSWRIVATSDTILIVLIVTCLTGQCSIENAFIIGTAEFLIKFFIYYLHERLWQQLLNNKKVTKRQTLHKTISWRLIATTLTFLISGTILEAFDQIALYIALTELFTKFALYYAHERLWLKLPLGRIRQFLFRKKQ
ncbi:DUF2061 domain-containing protein [Psychroserpens sp. MEBiC05023]